MVLEIIVIIKIFYFSIMLLNINSFKIVVEINNTFIKFTNINI